jgi:preprotein translocase subunit SecA
MAGRGTDILLGGNPEGLAAGVLETELFDRPLLTQLALTLISEGEEPARQAAQKHPKLSEDLVAELLSVQAKFDEAMTYIEKEQVIGYLSRTLQQPYEIDYNHLRNVLRLVRGGQLGEARDYLEQIEKDVALVDDIVRQWDIYTQYQTAQASEQRKAQFLAEMVFDRNYNGRAALIRAVLAGESEEARQIAQTVPGLSLAVIERIEQLQSQSRRERREVWQLGGLHVIGSERHESRRIDNQLRGRAARQGDPGSSRFFLSLEDELMRRFGGERLKNFMARTNIPDDMPIEARVLDRLIESSQERLEGFNFDMRKNIVEYDDVMNLQRQAIYDERRAILLSKATDLDEKLNEAFANSIAELVDNYVDNYRGFVRSEVERVIGEFSTEATDSINVNGIVRQLRGLLPAVVELNRDDLAGLSAAELTEEFMELAAENEEQGHNLLQLLQAMGRFLPLLPPVPNLGALALRKSGQLQAKEVVRREFLQQVEMLFNDFLAEHIEQSKRDDIWEKASAELDRAVAHFNLDGLSLKTAESRQTRFRDEASETLRDLLLESLSALDGDQLVTALNEYVQKQRRQWRERIGEEEYTNFRRLLMLSAIDREWRDYLTAMDDLRREIGLSAIAQRDPKVEYKRRSYEMFHDMRRNIERDMVDRFFRQIIAHQAFIQQQEAEVAYQTNAQEAGYEVVKRGDGKAQLKRAVAKVGRNDPCPCGSGKKYKQCHMRQDQAKASGRVTAVAANGQRQPSKNLKKKKKKSRRR